MSPIKKNQNSGDRVTNHGIDQQRVAKFLLDVKVRVSVELGAITMPVAEILKLQPGQFVGLGIKPDSPLKVYVDGKLFAFGEAVVVGGKVGIRVISIVGHDLPPKDESTDNGSHFKASA